MARTFWEFGRSYCLGLALFVAGCIPAPNPAEDLVRPAASQITLDRSSYRLASGDRIRIEVYGEPDLSLEALVEAAGTLNYPLLGRIVAQGYTLRDLEQLIARRLGDGYLVNPSVRASMVQFRPFYMTGQVRKVGAYPYVEGLTVEKALALAGGMTEIGSVRKIFILREGLRSLRERADMTSPILPGDTVVVDESLF